MTLSFTDRVAFVTGAGSGLGRAHALALAARGARVVVNDMDAGNAAAVVAEIERGGGVAMAAVGSVTDAAAIAGAVTAATGRWGGLHILINNAGVLRDRSFAKMSRAEWDMVIGVHLTGAFVVSQAVWETMRAQAYGRILMTTSSNGLYGAFGQANYSAAKMGLIGLMKTLSIEGAKYNIRVNAIAPVAATAMTQKEMPAELAARFGPDRVAPVALHLVGDHAPSGAILSTGGGIVHAAHVAQTVGVMFDGDGPTPDDVATGWDAIVERADAAVPTSGADEINGMFHRKR